MKPFARSILQLFFTALACAGGFSIVTIIVTHMLSADRSPGIIAVAVQLSRSWIPLIFLLVAIWFVGIVIRVFWQVIRHARDANLSVSQYLELPPAQKIGLREQHRRDS